MLLILLSRAKVRSWQEKGRRDLKKTTGHDRPYHKSQLHHRHHHRHHRHHWTKTNENEQKRTNNNKKWLPPIVLTRRREGSFHDFKLRNTKSTLDENTKIQHARAFENKPALAKKVAGRRTPKSNQTTKTKKIISTNLVGARKCGRTWSILRGVQTKEAYKFFSQYKNPCRRPYHISPTAHE